MKNFRFALIVYHFFSVLNVQRGHFVQFTAQHRNRVLLARTVMLQICKQVIPPDQTLASDVLPVLSVLKDLFRLKCAERGTIRVQEKVSVIDVKLVSIAVAT